MRPHAASAHAGTGFLSSRWLPLVPLVLSAVLMRLFWYPLSVTADGHTYLQIARNIQSGIGLGWQALWAAPLSSLIIAGVDSLFGIRDLLRTAGLLAPVMGVLLTGSVYFLAAGLFGRKTALLAALVTAVTPHLLLITFSTEPEIYYTVFLVTALGLLDRAVTRTSLRHAAASGVMFCGAYLSRSEGFLIMALTAAALLAVQGRHVLRSSVLRIVAVMTVVFFLAASPYLLFLKQHYGAFVISPKATYVLIWMKGRIYHDHDKGEQGNDELWGLTPEGKLKWQQPSGIGDLARYLAQDPGKSARVYLHNLSLELPGRVPNNSGTLHFPNVFPVYLAFCTVLSFLFPWGAASRSRKAAMAAPFLILLILPVFTEGWWKYLVPYAPLLIVLAAGGLVYAVDFACQRFRPEHPRIGTVLLAAGTLALMAYDLDRYGNGLVRKALAPETAVSGTQESSHDPSRAARLNYAEEARAAGQWAALRYGPGKNYMVTWNKMIYYLNGLWTPLPVADPIATYRYALRNRVDLLVLEVHDPEFPDAGLASAAPGFILDSVYHSKTSTYRVAFFRPFHQSQVMP
jgi:4-amino-4-deoxy-L-arabinose transferase-like glycosyltransferase